MSDGSSGHAFSYFEPVDAVVGKLTQAFGTAPAVSEEKGVNHTPPHTVYEWTGVRILDWHTEVSRYAPDWAVRVDEPVVHGLELSTIDGIRAGDSALHLETAYPELSWRATPTGFPERIDLRLGSMPIEGTEEELASLGVGSFEGYDGPKEPSFAVFLSATGPDWDVHFVAPADNFGP